MKQSIYQGSIILGLNDAIVSLTGLIAGLFFAFTDSKIIIITCIISSITAALSMGAANYLATKSGNQDIALKSAICTASAYIITCVFLILPFFVLKNRDAILVSVILMAVFIIFVFNRCCYDGKKFRKKFFEMLALCTAVSIIAFFIGEIAHQMFGVRF